MVSSSKILTVSYGTFSCTAEGFEDPLGAVKDATHFFRGVIREDRFFGAEPPQIDSDMAAELFQSQIAAQQGQGQLTLRSPYVGHASAGALSAALAAGPSVMRAAAPLGDAAEQPRAEADLPSGDRAGVRDSVQATPAAPRVAPTVSAPAPVPEGARAPGFSETRSGAETLEELTAPAPGSAAVAPESAHPFSATVPDHGGGPAQMSEAGAKAQAAPVQTGGDAAEPSAGAEPESSDLGDTIAAAVAAAQTARPVSAPQADADLRPAPLAAAPEAAAGQDNLEAEVDFFGAEDAPLSLSEPEPADEPAPRLADPESVAAKLRRIRAVVSGAAPQSSEPDAQATAPGGSAPLDAPDHDGEAALAAQLEAQHNNLFTDTLGGVSPEDQTAATDESEAYVSAAEVKQVAALAEPVPVVSRPAGSVPAEANTDLAEDTTLRAIEDSLNTVFDEEDGTFESAFEDAPDEAFSGRNVSPAPLVESEQTRDEDRATGQSMLAEEFEDDEDLSRTALADLPEPAPTSPPFAPKTAAPSTVTPASKPAPTAAPAAPVRPRVRVVKVKRAAFNAALAAGTLADAEPAPSEPINPISESAQGIGSSLSAEDENDLARELAAVKAELKADFDHAWDDEDIDDLDAATATATFADEGDLWDEDKTTPEEPQPSAAAPKRDDESGADDWDEDDWDDAWDDMADTGMSDKAGSDETISDKTVSEKAGAVAPQDMDEDRFGEDRLASGSRQHDELRGFDDLDEFEDEFEDDDDGFDEDEPLRSDAAGAAPLSLSESASVPGSAGAGWDADLDTDLDDEFDDDFDASIAAPLAPKKAPAQSAAPVARDPEEDAQIEQMAREGVRKAVKMSSPARALLTENTVMDNDASRILDETNSHLKEPEGNRRRSAIAHLRAAVAATRADRLMGRKKDAEEAIEPYREDLANVVRPRRPEPGEHHTERPSEVARPAPLKLVAEQRVDPAAPAAPPRPRRVTIADLDDTADLAGSEEEGGFVAYAESVGATELSDLLEAAAAYLSYVEGREQFSRPQLMTKVRQVEVQESSREDRLRSFGQLLREGKIEKTRGGRFTASERISFKPGARAFG